MKVIILAGGKGTRLGKLTETIPKPMVPLAGKPLLEYQVELCAQYGVREIIIIINHLGNVIKDYFGNGSKWKVDISYFEEAEPLGTVGGVKEIEEKLQDDFLVIYGDVMMEMDLDRLINFHRGKESELTLVVHPNDHPYDSDLLELNDEERITGFYSKPHPENFRYHNIVNAGVYLFTPKIFPFLEKGMKADFGKDIFPVLTDQLRMYGYNTPEYIKDMGTPQRLKEVEEALNSGKIERRSLRNRQKAIFLDRDGVINEHEGLIANPEDLHLYNYTAEAIRKINQSEYLAILATNQSVVARNLTTIAGLHEIHKKMETELGEAGAKLDDIQYCPHHPDKGYPEENPIYKIDCDCRKPKAGMLLRSAEKFNIDLSRSYFIGDSERDHGAALAAGCQYVGLRSGEGNKTGRLSPSVVFQDLKQAVEFILDPPYSHLAEQIRTEISANPSIIGIGGNSRSGKSIFATYLQNHLLENGISSMRIELDDWIISAAERKEGDVLNSFQHKKMLEDLETILSGGEVKLTPYLPHPERKSCEKVYKYQNEQVIIIEGVIALATEDLRKLYHQKVFLQIDKKLQRQRFEEFYRWKGKSEPEIAGLWQQRQREYDYIASNVQYADIVI